ncbi:MAG: LPS export ABC transporter permease LptG [Proteobacteria bacterium]|nr:LPS export ABC transporter permease LptG [Pseudomonadota bacterium]
MIIERYIIKKCLFNTFLVLFSCVMLFAVFTILGESSDIGKGNFTIFSMGVYITALMPSFAYLLMPLAVLIGVMLGMLSLVNYSEYAIIRTSGVSLKKITAILFIFGAFFSVLTFTLGELVAPNADHFAKVYKMTKLRQLVSTNLHSGIWSKDGYNTFINIKQVMPDNTILGVNIFYYNESLVLQQYISAIEGSFDANTKVWNLKNVAVLDYTKQNIEAVKFQNYSWKTSIDPAYFNILVIAPEDMSIFALLKYMHHLEQANQSINRYEIAFWNKLIYPIACLSMALLAIAFVPNNRRNVNLAAKLTVGIIIGVAFFFVSKLVGYMALLFAWNPIASSLTPTTLLFISGWYFILRKES